MRSEPAIVEQAAPTPGHPTGHRCRECDYRRWLLSSSGYEAEPPAPAPLPPAAVAIVDVLAQIRELHRPAEIDLDPPPLPICVGCSLPWPCPTIRALDGAH